MSLLTKASTVTTPTAYDGGVLNSVKPVSRENLLLQSNQFDTTWVNASSSETGGQSGYDGSNDAWLIDITAAGGRIYQSVSQSGVSTYSIYAKAGSLNWIILSSNIADASFDLSNGIKGTLVGGISSSIESVGGGWYRCSASLSGSLTQVRIYPSNADNDFTSTSGNIYIQDAQLQKGITATQYVETTTAALENADFSFARASSATRVNEQGLIEKERENLLLQSNQFDTTWIPTDLTLTGNQSGYDSSTDAWLLDVTSGTCCQQLRQSVSCSGVNTFSVYVKSGTAEGCLLFGLGSGNPYADFDLITGTTGSLYATAFDSKIESVGGGWYRCSMSFTGSITQVRIYPADASGGISQTSGSIYIQDAQLEQGLVATDYIETTSSAVYGGITDNIPRLDYYGSCPSLLLEPQRTNLYQHSEYIFNFQGTGTFNDSNSPEGVSNAVLLTKTSASDQFVNMSWSGSSLSASTDYTMSLFVKHNGDDVDVRYEYNNSNDWGKGWTALFQVRASGVTASTTAYCTSDVEDYGNGWYRILVFVETASSITPSSPSNLLRVIGASGDEVLVYGAGMEQGSYATTYIPTFGSAVTRAAETCNNAGNSDLFNDSEGVLYAEIAALDNDLTQRHISISDGTIVNVVRIHYHTSSNSIRGQVRAGGVIQASLTYIVPDIKDFHKVALSYKENDVKLYIDGVLVLTDTSASMPTGLDELSFNRGDGGLDFYGKTKMVSTFTEALSDSELECLTSWSSFNRMATAQNYTIE